MKFGKLEQIDEINFDLPEDHPITQKFLQPQKHTLQAFSGGTMWGIKAWKGKIYPPKTPVKDFGEAYCRQFGCIELNATHYRIHPASTIEKWANLAPKGFEFCPKWPQLITHYRRFTNSEGLTDEFLTAISAFGDKLGPVFIQLPPNYTPKYADRLMEYLASLPKDIRIAVEFRHPDWFIEEHSYIWEFLLREGIGAVISDTAGRRDAVHMALTAPFLVLRFGGYNQDPSDFKRFDDWVDRIEKWNAGGLKSLHLLMHQPDSITTPESCIYFNAQLEKRLGIKMKTPQLISSQGALF